MSTGAIVMMCVACIGLWGGIGVSVSIMIRANNRKAEALRDKNKQS